MNDTNPTSSTAAEQAALIKQAIAQGPITEAYQADPQQIVHELNQLRATAITSILQNRRLL